MRTGHYCYSLRKAPYSMKSGSIKETMGSRAKVKHRAPQGTIARRIDDYRAANGLSRWQLWRAMQEGGYHGKRQAVYRALNGGVRPSYAFVAAAVGALGPGAAEELFGGLGGTGEGVAKSHVEAVLVGQGRPGSAAKVEAEVVVAARRDRLFMEALEKTLGGLLPRPAPAEVRRYSRAAADGIHTVLSSRNGNDPLLEQRINALVGFARSVFLLGLALDGQQFRLRIHAAAEHLHRAESGLSRLRKGPTRSGATGDLAAINAELLGGYHRFATQSLAALLALN